MTRESLVFLLGLLVLLTPFMGLPAQWKQYLLVGVGVLLLWCGYSLRRRLYLSSIADSSGELHADSFSESPATNHPTTSEPSQI